MNTHKRVYNRRQPGDKIGDGELIERVNNRLWKIRCRCGEVFIAQPSDSFGRCVKCGREVRARSNKKHGESPRPGRNATRLYGIWVGMRARCNEPNYHSYPYYGGRGISVSEEWNDYLTFKDWALSHGYRDDLSIDRINNDGNYTPDNCRWATNEEQAKNKRHPPYKYGRNERGQFLPKEGD